MSCSYELPAGLDTAQRLKTGAFYTPPHIVDFMVSMLLEGKKEPLRICDFSCGGGAFLSGVLRWVKSSFPADCTEWCRNLYGMDINPEAITLARKNLPDIPEENFICTDTLSDTLHSFDLIIGNPPYRCGGLRNRDAFPAEKQALLKEAFPCGFEYKMNLFALFTEQASRRSHEFALIVPDSLLCGRYFSKLRRYLTEEFHLKALCVLEQPGFDAAMGSGVILHASRTDKALHARKTLCRRFRKGEKLDLSDACETAQSRFLAESRCRFQLANSPEHERIMAKIFESSRPLKEFFTFASGIIARKGKESIVTRTPGADARPGIIYGREVMPFEISPEGFFIKTDPAKIKSGLNHERFTNKKIFLRQTGSTLVAAVSEEPLYALNNCHVGSASGDFPLETLAALLNSTLLKCVFRYLSGETNREFAQIDIDLLKELPLRRTAAFDRFARRCAKEPAARRELDERCAELYGLTPEEMAILEGQ